MLIVNADDFGRNQAATDRVLECHAKGRISSTSAMVLMQDSERAAALAQKSGLDVGLHVNLSERFTMESVPASVRKDHDRICRFLRSSKYALLLYHPGLCAPFRRTVEVQRAEFTRLYGRLPSHYDGHQHLHLATNVLIQGILPPETKVRRNFSFRPGEKSLANRCYRSVVDRILARRHLLTDYFFSLSQHMSPVTLRPIVEMARTANVELMVHPEIQAEFDFLMSDGFHAIISSIRVGSYAML